MRRTDMRMWWGVVLIAVGLVLLADRLLGLELGSYGWPLVIVGVGVFLLAAGLAGLDTSRQAVIPGSIVTTVGLILLYQNTFDHYESWAYAWALIPVSVGLGRALHAARTGGDARGGLDAAGSFTVVFLIGLAFFEGVLNISGRGSDALVAYAVPIGLILVGLWLVARRAWRPSGERGERPTG